MSKAPSLPPSIGLHACMRFRLDSMHPWVWVRFYAFPWFGLDSMHVLGLGLGWTYASFGLGWILCIPCLGWVFAIDWFSCHQFCFVRQIQSLQMPCKYSTTKYISSYFIRLLPKFCLKTGIRGMAQCVKYSQCKHEDLDSYTQHQHRSQAWKHVAATTTL